MHPAIVIVGGGPAGLAAGLHLHQQAPHLAEKTIILEAADYPRPKLCGGGITVHGEEQLAKLGLTIDVPSFQVEQLTFKLGQRTFSVAHPTAMRVINRAEFDAALAAAARQRGLCIHNGERLKDIQRNTDGTLTLITDKTTYRPKVVIGADGANSTVRHKLRMASPQGVARLLRVMTSLDTDTDPLWQSKTALFDFSCVQQGVQGYAWNFPCYLNGQPTMNRGIFDSRLYPNRDRPRRALTHAFDTHLQQDGHTLDTVDLKGHPVRWFNPNSEFARPHILLTGDAAGVDPLFAEGISYAMEYGEIVATTLLDAFQRDDFSFSTYQKSLRAHRLGKLLARRTWVAKTLYNSHLWQPWQILWRFAAVASTPLQQMIGRSLALLP